MFLVSLFESSFYRPVVQLFGILLSVREVWGSISRPVNQIQCRQRRWAPPLVSVSYCEYNEDLNIFVPFFLHMSRVPITFFDSGKRRLSRKRSGCSGIRISRRSWRKTEKILIQTSKIPHYLACLNCTCSRFVLPSDSLVCGDYLLVGTSFT